MADPKTGMAELKLAWLDLKLASLVVIKRLSVHPTIISEPHKLGLNAAMRVLGAAMPVSV